MAANSASNHGTPHRRSWTPPHISVSHENDDIDSTHVDQLDASYLGHRLRDSRRGLYPATPELDDVRSQRRKRRIDSDDETSTVDGQAMPTGPYFDAIRNTYTASSPTVPLSQESLRALNTRSGQSSTRVRGWLRDATAYSLDAQRRKKHSVEYMLQEDGQGSETSAPAPLLQPPALQKLQHECVNCKRLFNTKSELRHHARRYEKRPYDCDQCDKSFLYPKDLRRHKTTHSGSKSHECSSCQKAFSRKDNLRRHMINEHGREASSQKDGNVGVSAADAVPHRLAARDYDQSIRSEDAETRLANALDSGRLGDTRPDFAGQQLGRVQSHDGQGVLDNMVDPLMRLDSYRTHGSPDGRSVLRHSGTHAYESHERLRSAAPAQQSQVTSKDLHRDDVAIAQKALSWNKEEESRTAVEARADVPATGSNPNLKALEVN